MLGWVAVVKASSTWRLVGLTLAFLWLLVPFFCTLMGLRLER